MKYDLTKPLILLLALGLIVFLGLAFSSFTATDCVAHLKGGQGTVDDPLQIEVSGHAGLVPLLDSLLPFRAIPAIDLSYTGNRFDIPGANVIFKSHNIIAQVIYVVLLVIFVMLVLLIILRLLGKRITFSTTDMTPVFRTTFRASEY